LWMAGDHDDSFARASVKTLRGIGAKFEELSTAKMKKRWAQINFEGIRWAIFEPECGYLEARTSCAAVVEAFVAAGGRYLQTAVSTDGVERGEFVLSDGSQIKADAYVFACGPWLGKLFPQTIGGLIRPTKQDIFFFGAPAGDTRFDAEHLPVWGDHHGRFLYGIPGSDRRGFKVADDTRGGDFDPTAGERVVSVETLAIVREYVGFRFPGLKDAPLVETRVCQYEQTPDENFIVDRHPEMENVWIVGGGSGHGFKHGPALGEMMAGVVLGKRELVDGWRLGRFGKKSKS
jgi:sarcosine oxidase